MSNNFAMQAFLDAAEDWVCDSYSLDIRYIAIHTGSDPASHIWQAAIALHPLQSKADHSFQIKAKNFRFGQVQKFPQKKKDLLQILGKAARGLIDISDAQLILPSARPHDYYSEMSHRERWFSELHLQVNGSQAPSPSPMELAAVDNELRASTPPFDGVVDVASWLGLLPPEPTTSLPSITIRVGPPCDLIFDKCTLAHDQLHLTLHAHPKFDTSRVGLAVRGVPGVGLSGRQQISGEIEWSRSKGGRRVGTANVNLAQADSALAMLRIGASTVRRQWFLDPTKSRNNRLLAVQHFDKDLRMIRQAVTESTDSTKFEQGIAALLFLLGFTPSIQVESDSPDLIVTTPEGRMAIVECTTRTSDFGSKVGKLVDRRGALNKSLSASGHPSDVVAVLVCRLPRDQIATQADELRTHNTILLAGEDLNAAFDQLRHPSDPDRILKEALARLTQQPRSALPG